MKSVVLAAVLLASLSACAGSGAISSRNRPSQNSPVYLLDGRMLVDGAGYVEPALVKRVEPEYSAAAREKRRQGQVVLSCVVDAEGNVSGVRLVESAGEDLDRASIAAVLKWKYTPATLHGKKVGVYFTVTLTYRMVS